MSMPYTSWFNGAIQWGNDINGRFRLMSTVCKGYDGMNAGAVGAIFLARP